MVTELHFCLNMSMYQQPCFHLLSSRSYRQAARHCTAVQKPSDQFFTLRPPLWGHSVGHFQIPCFPICPDSPFSPVTSEQQWQQFKKNRVVSREKLSKGNRPAVAGAEGSVVGSAVADRERLVVGSAMAAISVRRVSSSSREKPFDGFWPFSISFPSDFFVNLVYVVVFPTVSTSATAKIIKRTQSQENIHMFEAGRKI